MMIYTNERYEIVALNNRPFKYKMKFQAQQTREKLFGELCNTCILGYKYEPQYQMIFNEDGSNARDEKNRRIAL